MTDPTEASDAGVRLTRPGPNSSPGRRRPGVSLSAVLPGFPQVLKGRWGTGGLSLTVWLGLLAVLLTRWSRFAAGWGGPLDHRIASLTVVAGLLGAWGWSMFDVSRPAEERRRGTGQWGLAAQAFRKNRIAVIGVWVVAWVYLIALVTPLISPHDPATQASLLTARLVAPGGEFPLGTDHLARDVFSRIMYGARISLSIGFVAVGISVTIGTLLGAVSGYLGGWFDTVVMRFVDMVISFPRLVLLIAIVALFESNSIFLIMAVLGLTQWPGTARIVRGEVLSLREREFIEAARSLGFSRRRIILRHVIPNALAPVIVTATLGIGNVIVLEAGLSFLGLGLQPPTPSWGSMVSDGRAYLLDAWWISTFSGLAIVLTVVAVNLVGDGLRDALDPRLRT
jgi:peptide/nickel transport system permease protein